MMLNNSLKTVDLESSRHFLRRKMAQTAALKMTASPNVTAAISKVRRMTDDFHIGLDKAPLLMSHQERSLSYGVEVLA
jgi:hypothetical protein